VRIWGLCAKNSLSNSLCNIQERCCGRWRRARAQTQRGYLHGFWRSAGASVWYVQNWCPYLEAALIIAQTPDSLSSLHSNRPFVLRPSKIGSLIISARLSLGRLSERRCCVCARSPCSACISTMCNIQMATSGDQKSVFSAGPLQIQNWLISVLQSAILFDSDLLEEHLRLLFYVWNEIPSTGGISIDPNPKHITAAVGSTRLKTQKSLKYS
jgi:hypothetical protein